MKNIKNSMLLKLYFLASISIFLFASCSNDDSSGSSGKLEVTGISRSVVDDPLVEGDRKVDVPTDIINAGNYYIIRGSGFSTLKSISFNGLESYFNPTFVTDNAIVVLVDSKTPYYNEMDEMKIVTGKGTLSYKVAIRPPSPNITGFPINPNPGDIITITGEYFLRPVVNFGDIQVEPISSTLTEIQVKVPEGSYLKSLSVTNVSGTTVAPETIGSGIYDDASTNIWGWEDLWDDNNELDKAYAKDVKQGLKCIQWKSGEWDGYVIGINNWSYHDTDKFKAIRFWIKGEKAGKVKFFANDVNVEANTEIIEIKSSWTYFEIPYTAVGSPTEISNIGFQEFGGFGGNVIYLDNIGFVLK
ncbi:IPT/TIG domain-containing protein [Flavobacterium sp. LPB0248]|uniref:IPT/TIG domain-containing protein n=1 Tax=Flavobacterium sp. LPB0248 TaxID=2614441 RepID=UPI0015A529DC|nr:IPT/TIG domain-containing protein [Flavobacterium sp. LPB0248]QLC67896.1 IPT/TIG domain-containing protein [Flavobacterium sp. LPB0248]